MFLKMSHNPNSSAQLSDKKLDFIITQGEAILMSLDNLDAKIQELVDAQKANADAVTAEIAKLDQVIADLKALPTDTSAQEAVIQTVIDGLKATTTQAATAQ